MPAPATRGLQPNMSSTPTAMLATPMGKQRAANGHPEPYHVKFWGVGNEMWGISYQFGAMKPNQFAFKHNEFAKAMRKIDPTIKLIVYRCHAGHHDRVPKNRLSLGTRSSFRRTCRPGTGVAHVVFELLQQLRFDERATGYNYGATHFSLAERKRRCPMIPNEPITDWMRRPANHIRIKIEEYKEYEKCVPAARHQS